MFENLIGTVDANQYWTKTNGWSKGSRITDSSNWATNYGLVSPTIYIVISDMKLTCKLSKHIIYIKIINPSLNNLQNIGLATYIIWAVNLNSKCNGNGFVNKDLNSIPSTTILISLKTIQWWWFNKLLGRQQQNIMGSATWYQDKDNPMTNAVKIMDDRRIWISLDISNISII